MPRFFCSSITPDSFSIIGEDAKHIAKVLRMKENDTITVSDMMGTDYQCIIKSLSDSCVTGDVLESSSCRQESAVKVTLYMAMPKGDKAEFIIQKAVELGAKEIVFMLTNRCVSRPDDKTFSKKLERYNKISLEAAKQCGRGIIPKVRGLMSYNQALDEIKNINGILFYENATAPLSNILSNSGNNIGIIIGSEGGFEEEEVEKAIAQDIPIASLGRRILRCETAPIVALSAIMYSKGEF